MTKRITALLLALLMVIGTIPAPAFATDGSNATEETTQTICSVCNLTDCTATHIQCEKCGNYDCTTDHSNWCDTCKLDNCGVDHGAVADITVCDVCGNEVCTCEPTVDNCAYCEETTAEDGTVTHAEGCNAAYVYDGTADVGKYAKLNEYYADSTVIVLDGTEELIFNYSDFESGLIFSITDWKWDPTTTALWYKVDACRGTLPAEMPAEAWILQNYTNDTEENSLLFVTACDICGEYDCATEHIQCGICGEYGCTALHFYCDICTDYDCGEAHLYCNVCGIYDCIKSHVWCGSCGNYDCGTEHENVCKPVNEPVIPEDPTLTEGADVSLVDEYGDPVTEEGFVLFEGTKSSLSAWSELEGDISYQWQVCYDSANDLWADIRGQTGKGILVSPAMFLSIIGEQDTVYIRCVMSTDGETQTSAAIPVTVAEPSVAFGLRSSALASPAATEDIGELSKAYVVVQYVYEDGRIAAATEIAEIIPGSAYSLTHQLAVIPGYKATLNTHSYGDSAKIEGGNLIMNFAEGALTDEYTIFTVTYEPDFVSYTVIHYWQNVDNDNYTEYERETISTTHKTGDVIADAHKSYPGFYNLLYETPAAAADGSTVIEVYYDRYYYLMKFELDGGYGVDPIYARYADDVEIAVPTKAGYEFVGWTDAEGNAVTIPAAVPVNGGTYYAKWNPVDTEYTVTYWIRNEDGTEETYVGSKIVGAESGSTVSGSDDLTVETNTCGMPEHSHDSCTQTCPLDEHTHGDGKCIYQCGINYHDHTSGCVYDCGQESHATHTRTCYEFSSANVDDDSTNVTFNEVYTTKDGFNIYRQRNNNQWHHYVQIGSSYYRINNYNNNTSLAYTLTCHVHSNACCSVEYHDHSDCECIVVPHVHTANCYNCGTIAHSHSDDCKSDLAKYVDFIEADQNVTVKGDGSTVVNVYYEYRTYTIRFLYARQNATGGNSYQIATLTGNGNLATGPYQGGPYWQNVSSLPDFEDPSGKTERSTVTIGNYTYYYISLTAKFGEDISTIWPSANIGNAGNYEWGSWAAAAGTGYRETYGDEHANIVGPYPVMSADLIVDDPEKLADGSYLAQNMIAWWGNNQGIEAHAYHNYFELLPGDTTDAVLYNGKYYKLVETYTFTAAHNGDTRVDPIFFNGFQCINDSRDTDNDTQANSENFDNGGNCEICGNACNYCNTFYYDRNMHKLYFWNHNGPLMDDTGSDVMYGTSLVNHGAYVSTEFMNRADNYPEGIEPGAFQFVGWYTTAECYDGTEMDWTITMPDADMTVYAKWIPVTHTVNYFLTEESLERGENIPAEMDRLVQEAIEGGIISAAPAADPYSATFAEDTIQHGAYIEDLSTPGVSAGYENIHPRAGYEFIGWFYLNADGKETAFDPENMPVHQDLDLYAKWSANKLCQYNIYFALDEDLDGIADTDVNGNIIYIADPDSGSGIAGHTYTFSAKGGEALYDPEGDANYREGYFPTVGSHSITIDLQDEEGTGTNSFTFLYQPKQAAPYTVKYLEQGTNTVLFPEKNVIDNKNIVVTENFEFVQGYMPDAYQKTLVVTAGGENEIIFWYTADRDHALYVVNYYIQELDSDLKHAGWSKYNSLQNTGDIGTDYTADAITIGGFTLSASYTDDYNVTRKINGMEGTSLPSTVGSLSGQKLTGTLSDQGMELNFYYTRNLYPYEFRYMLNGTSIELAEPEVGMGAYDSIVTETAREITMDLDGDGINEDYRLYDPTATTKDIHIIVDGEALSEDAIVTEGQATVNVATFYYVRCTQTMTITKTVVDNSAELDPDPDQTFTFSLLIHAKNGYHQSNYAYTKSDGTQGTLSPELTAPNTLQFTLKAGQTITIDGLPTAEYTVSELNLPTGYYDTAGTNVRNKLTVDGKLDLTVTNTYEPVNLTVQKTVNVVEGDTNTPEVTDFQFTITVPSGVTGTYAYVVEPISDGETANREVTVSDGKIVISLKNGQTATFTNLPIGSYVVTEAAYEDKGYNDFYSVNGAEAVDSDSATVTLTRGTTQTVECLNKFPVGDLIIEKTVTKEFYGTEWSGDTFTFTLERTTTGRPLVASNQYKVLIDGVEQDATIAVDDNGKLTVEITFDGTDAAKLDEETEANASASHTLTIKNLPAGTYKVTETVNTAYTQTPTDLTVSVTIPAETTEAEFVNQLKRPTGSLSLTKILEAATGFNPDELPKGTKFSFTIELTEQPPTDSQTFTVVYNETTFTDGTATPTSVAMANGTFTVELEAGQTVTISGLPIGKYRITEATIPQYANNFAHIVNGVEEVQTPKVTSDGCLYTEINVTANATAEVKCTNTYPVDRAELVIQKLVNKEYDRDTLPTQTFTFTVTMTEEDTGINSYDYKVYNSDGTEDTASSRAATVTDRKFTVSLKAGQYAVIPNMPVCGYTVSENVDTSDYNASYEVYVSETGESASTQVNTTGTVNASGTEVSVSRIFSAGKTDTIVFTNEYKRHLGTLTITKTVNGGSADDTFIFHIKGTDVSNSYIDMDVTITGSGSVTIYDLPLGNYTVTEDTDWNWRYQADVSSQTVDLEENADAEVKFINKYTENRWLNYTANMPNEFGKKENE